MTALRFDHALYVYHNGSTLNGLSATYVNDMLLFRTPDFPKLREKTSVYFHMSASKAILCFHSGFLLGLSNTTGILEINQAGYLSNHSPLDQYLTFSDPASLRMKLHYLCNTGLDFSY